MKQGQIAHRLPTVRWAHVPVAMALALVLAGAASSLARAFDPLGSPCRLTTRSWSHPTWTGVGETIGVTSRVRFDCPDRQHPYHLALVVDRSAVVPGGPAAWAIDELEDLAGRLTLDLNPRAWVGLVAFGEQATTLCALTNQAEDLQDCLRQLDDLAAGGFAGGSGLADGIREGTKALMLARGMDPPRPTDDPLVEELLVLARPDLSGGQPAQSCGAARPAADTAKEEGIEVGVVCVTGDCAASCLPDLSSPGHFFAVTDWETMTEWERAAAEQVRQAWSTRLRVRSVSTHEIIGPQMVFKPDSLDPAGAIYDPERGTLHWSATLAEQSEFSQSYAVVATVPGRWSVRNLGYGQFVDSRGHGGSFYLPELKATVAARGIIQIHLPWLYRSTGGSKTFVNLPR